MHYHGLPIVEDARKLPAAENYGADNNVVRELRPLLAAEETVRRCVSCGRAYVGPQGAAAPYCSMASCQLKSRRAASSHTRDRKAES